MNTAWSELGKLGEAILADFSQTKERVDVIVFLDFLHKKLPRRRPQLDILHMFTCSQGLKEGCPSSPPLFNVYHQAVLTDYRLRRKRNADQLGL